MSKTFSAFYDVLLPELKGCSTGMVDHHLKMIAREFCERSSAWRAEFEAIDSEADTLHYQFFTAEPNTDLVRVLKLTIDGTVKWQASDQRPDDTATVSFAPDRPPFQINAMQDEIWLNDQPTGQILIEGSMKPRLAVTVLPDILYDQHLEAMRTGTLARLKRMVDKPWGDGALSIVYESDYQAHINLAAVNSARGNTRAQLRTRHTPI